MLQESSGEATPKNGKEKKVWAQPQKVYGS